MQIYKSIPNQIAKDNKKFQYKLVASNAIDIIYFPSLKIKNKIISEVFRKGGKMSK